MITRCAWLLLGAVVPLVGGPLDGAAAKTVTGTVAFQGTLAQPQVEVTQDAHVCGARVLALQNLLRQNVDGALEGVIVYFEPRVHHGSAPQERAPTKVVVDQKDCMFTPGVVVLERRDVLIFRNSDAVLHNVSVLGPDGRVAANFAMPVRGQSSDPITLHKTGPYSFRCEAGHPWMRGHALVFERVVATKTNSDGSFVLGPVSRGLHDIHAWHPLLGRLRQRVAVAEGDPRPILFEYRSVRNDDSGVSTPQH